MRVASAKQPWTCMRACILPNDENVNIFPFVSSKYRYRNDHFSRWCWTLMVTEVRVKLCSADRPRRPDEFFATAFRVARPDHYNTECNVIRPIRFIWILKKWLRPGTRPRVKNGSFHRPVAVPEYNYFDLDRTFIVASNSRW